MKAKRVAEAIFLDADGDELYRAVFSDARTLDRAMTAAKEKYRPRKIKWSRSVPRTGKASDKPVLVAFVDSREDSLNALKSLEDPRVAKLHDRFQFVRRTYRRGAKEMRDWSVVRAPTFLVLSPQSREVVLRQSGPQKSWELKKFLLEAVSKLEEERGGEN